MVQGSFTTEQERYVVIQALREFLTFPSTWAPKINQRKIVEWLLNVTPYVSLAVLFADRLLA